MTCVTGYTGTAVSISCQDSGAWTAQAGCTIVSCPSTPSQPNYVISAGASTYGSTRTVTCATGYTGTASAITCLSDATWRSSSGCTIVSCTTTPTQTGYTISAGTSTYGSTRTTTCASGLTGTGSSITCQASGSWTTASGCSSYCNIKFRAQTSTPEYMNLDEFKLFDTSGRQIPSSSLVYSQSRLYYELFPLSNCFDGVSNFCHGFSYREEGSPYPWVNIRYSCPSGGRSGSLSRVEVWNRPDCCQFRIDSYALDFYNYLNQVEYTYSFSNGGSTMIYTIRT